MKTLLLITEFKNGTTQVLIESEEMIYNRVVAMLHNNKNIKNIRVADKAFTVFEKSF